MGNVPKKWDILFYPIEPLSDSAKAELIKKTAETDKININTGVYTAAHVARSRYGERGWRAELLPVVSVEPKSVSGESAAPTAAADTALNGAQVTSALDIVTKTIAGQIPRQSGIAMLVSFFNLDRLAAEEMIGPETAPFKPPPKAPAGPEPSSPGMTTDSIPLRIEVPAGETRSGIDPDGQPWSIVMPCDYGEIPGTKGLDGEPVDYLRVPTGPRGLSFVIEQLLPPEEENAGTLDEHKVILGCSSEEEAKALLLQVYGADGHWGKIISLPEANLLPWLAARSDRRSYLLFDGIDMAPPQEVIEEIKKGLAWHAEGKSGKGLVPATVAWARRLARGAKISEKKVRSMRAWLSRNSGKGPGFNPKDQNFPSPGRVAWALWGGDPAVAWSNSLVEQLDRAKRA